MTSSSSSRNLRCSFVYTSQLSSLLWQVTTFNSSQSGLVSIFFKISRFIMVFNLYVPFGLHFTSKQITKYKRRNLTDDLWKPRREINRNEHGDRLRHRNRSRGRIRGRKQGGGGGWEGYRRWSEGRWREEVSQGYKQYIAIDPPIDSLLSPPIDCSTPSFSQSLRSSFVSFCFSILIAQLTILKLGKITNKPLYFIHYSITIYFFFFPSIFEIVI